MDNLKQITNYDIKDFNEHTKSVLIGGDKGEVKNVIYKEIPFEISIDKFGYCCEPKAIPYPIFIDNKTFYLGKTGMFEIQPEQWTDYNAEDQEEYTALIYINKIEVPWGIEGDINENYLGFNFKLDFIYSL